MSAPVDNLLKSVRPKMETAVKNFETELAGLRTGRATSALVENISVEAYGTRVPVKQVAYITVPDPASLVITPYDKGILKALEEALAKADLGTQPVNVGTSIRVNLPPPTEERRQELIKVAKAKAEAARIVIRSIRKDAWNEIQRFEDVKQISEDDRYYGEENLNRMVDEFNRKIEELLHKKEEEIKTV